MLPEHLKAQIRRELDRLELVIVQIKEVQAERDALLAIEVAETPAVTLLDLNGIGPKTGLLLGPCRGKRDIGAAVLCDDGM
jgi:transposase